MPRPWNSPLAIWDRIDVRDANECWPWTRGKSHDGYGRIQLRGRDQYAHRIAWELANRRSADGFLVLHSCDNPGCCNPAHLRLGSHTDNQRDAIERGRRDDRRGSQNHNAKLTETAVRRLRALRAQGATLRELAQEFGIAENTACMAARGTRWTHVEKEAREEVAA